MSRITEWAYRPFSKRQSKRAGCPFYQTLVLFLVLLTTPAFAQDDNVVTNLADLAQPAFGGSHSFYLAFTPWQWQACSLDEPRWVDFLQLACADLLQACTNLRASPQVYGMQLVVVQLTKNVLTGETLVQSECSTDVVMRIAALSDYQPAARWEDRGVWSMWQQWTNRQDCSGESDDPILPPTVTLKVLLANATDYSTYQSNLDAEAEVEASSASSSATSGRFSAMMEDEGGSGMMMDESGDPCVITKEAAPFQVVLVAPVTNGMEIVFESCSGHLYEVQSADELSSQTVWTVRALMIGGDGSTSWVDTNSAAYDHRFYRVQRYTFDGDADSDGLSNIDEFNLGTDMHNPDTDGDGLPDGVDADPTHYDHTPPTFTVTYPSSGSTIYP